MTSVESDKACEETFREVFCALPHNPWALVVGQVATATSGLQLPARVFDASYGHVARRVLAAYAPLFFESREYAAYLAVVGLVRQSVIDLSPRVAPAQLHSDLLRQAANRPFTAADFVRSRSESALTPLATKNFRRSPPPQWAASALAPTAASTCGSISSPGPASP